MEEELLEIVDEQGNTLRVAPRSEIHGNPALMHRVVHVLVFDSKGKLLLQKRSMSKDVAPGRWDTSVGGHVESGESLDTAVRRELEEELGIEAEPSYLYTYVHSNEYETEKVFTYHCMHDGPFEFNRQEIDEVRYWRISEIQAAMDGELLSDNFKHEIQTHLRHKSGKHSQVY